jgi:hypothetical protein
MAIGATLLVFANKQDLAGALSKDEIAAILELDAMVVCKSLPFCVCLFVCISIYLSVYMSVCLFVCIHD